MTFERRTCPRCGGDWYPWPGTKLTTHARCHFTAAAAADIYDLAQRFPRASQQRIATDLGVSVQVLRATLAYERKRRGGKPGHWGSGTEMQSPATRAEGWSARQRAQLRVHSRH